MLLYCRRDGRSERMEQESRKKMKNITMRMVFNQLVKELGYGQGKSMFEWYCQTYGVDIADDCPSTISHEVFGI